MIATTNYRKTEYSLMTVGASVSAKGISLPSKLKSMNLDYLCTKEIIDDWMGDEQEIKVFAHLPHTHLAGRSIYTKVVRNKTEVEYIGNNKYYDFNFQYINF